MISLTLRQQDVLRFIIGFQQAKGFSPSFREIAQGVGNRAVSRVALHLDVLEERGAIRRLASRARAIEVLVQLPIPHASDGAPLYHVRTEEALA
ncbi:MAG: hypothetical protein WC692_07575 [Erythrobacter sp.]|jgi:repressor LexA